MNSIKQKKKIYLVPHSHWDREWYFSYDTSNVLLHSNFTDFECGDQSKWFMDGQWSLVDDLIKWSPSRKAFIAKQIKEGNISVGPLFTQPDVLNSLGETIIRNFEVGDKMAQEFDVVQSKTAYLPDTFGFSGNLPQIMKHSNIENFIFWRGLKEEQLNKNDFFNWKGVDGSTIKSFVLRNGYYSLGSFYPYNEGKVYPKKNDPKYFLRKFEEVLEKIKGEHKEIILPLGGDQAPYMYYQKDFIKLLNKTSDKYEFILTNNYDKFLKEKKVSDEYSGDLRMPITGKIHRTISSSRYDIKKRFRTAEESLYHLLEPLEIFYASKDNDYDFEIYKTENILKPLMIAQTHDSLGGCNTDKTNDYQILRIERVQENIDSQIDLIMKKLLQTRAVKDETISIFNPLAWNNGIKKVMIVFSDSVENLNIDLENLSVRSLSSENISLNVKKPLYKNKIVIVAKNLEPMSLNTFDVSKTTEYSPKILDLSKYDDSIKVIIGDEELFLKIDLVEDRGDSYDFSPGNTIEHHITWCEGKEYLLNDVIFKSLKGAINDSPFELQVFKEHDNIKFKLILNNKFRNTRVSLVVEQANKDISVKKSLNMAITDFVEKDDEKNWDSLLKEYPAHVDVNDGIVILNNKVNIITKGTNEVYKTDKGVKLVLYRAYGNVTGENLKWRPSTSGLSWKEAAPESQLQKELEFDFEFNVKESIKSLNENKYEPYVYKMQQRNFIANKMTKFAINNILHETEKELLIEVDNKNLFISSIRKVGKKIVIRLVNMIDAEQKAILNCNNEKVNLDFKKYEIKEIKI